MKKVITTIAMCFCLKAYSQLDTNLMNNFVGDWLGRPYRFGGESKKGIDCSAFVQRFYKDVMHSDIPRTCYYQFKHMLEVGINDLRLGDVVYFASKLSPSGWHAGIYIGNDQFIHAANYKLGVVVSCLQDDRYKLTLKGVRRL
jgi:cell wall-associated NlpC family hydrolase